MTIQSNPHTHTTWCDGANTVDEMALSAIETGFTDLGFSSHSPAPFDPGCPGVQDLAAYRADVARARAAFAGRLDIACAIEQDYYGQVDRADYDYIIGAVHYLRGPNGAYHNVDEGPAGALRCRDMLFGGDGLAMARAFYELLVKNARECKPDIIAHFDLVALFNRRDVLFSEASPAYRSLALEAMDAAVEVLNGYGGMIEINTRAMVRGKRETPYPATFLLRRAHEKGARVILSSDCHKAGTLADGFAEALNWLRANGYRSVAVLKNRAFVDVSI